jgi:hypothetical protein
MSRFDTPAAYEAQRKSQMATDARRTRDAAEEANRGRVHLWVLTYVAVISLGVAIFALLKP